MKKFISLFMVMMLMVVFVSGCGKNDEGTSNQSAENNAGDTNQTETSDSGSAEEKEHYVFGASYFTLNNPHFIDWSEGLKSVIVNKYGDELVEADAQLDINKQISDVEDMIQQKVDAIFIAPVDSKGIKTALLSAERAGIPVIIMDVPVPDTDLIAASVTTDNFMAGKVLGEALVKRSGGKANVAIIDWSVNGAVVARTDGFFDAIKDYPDIKVVARQDGEASLEAALPIMENFLQANPEIDAVFGINDPSCMGALAAIEAAKRDDIDIYSIDGSLDGLKLTKEGRFVGTSAQFPVKMGETAGELVYSVVNGEQYEKDVKVESIFVDQDIVDDYLD